MSKSVTDIVREDAQARFHRIAADIASETMSFVSAKTGYEWGTGNMPQLSNIRNATHKAIVDGFSERYVEAAVQAAAKRLIG